MRKLDGARVWAIAPNRNEMHLKLIGFHRFIVLSRHNTKTPGWQHQAIFSKLLIDLRLNEWISRLYAAILERDVEEANLLEAHKIPDTCPETGNSIEIVK